VARIAHERGALVLADAYQAAGSVPLDVRELAVDFLVAGTVKYLLASAGLGFLWCRPEHATSLMPTQTGWFADEDIFRMDISDYSPHASARRFDAGTPPVPSIYAGLAGMAIVERTGVAAIETHVRALNRGLLDGLDALGARVVTPRPEEQRGALVCVASSDAEALVRELAQERIVTSSRDGNLRISLHLYNVAEDVDRVLDALVERRHLLA
jgi:selenocysteine lyase/cysteine desulfurase